MGAIKMNANIKQNTSESYQHAKKANVIAGYAFAGAWIGLVLGFTGLVDQQLSGQVSLMVTAVGALIGCYFVFNK